MRRFGSKETRQTPERPKTPRPLACSGAARLWGSALALLGGPGGNPVERAERTAPGTERRSASSAESLLHPRAASSTRVGSNLYRTLLQPAHTGKQPPGSTLPSQSRAECESFTRSPKCPGWISVPARAIAPNETWQRSKSGSQSRSTHERLPPNQPPAGSPTFDG